MAFITEPLTDTDESEIGQATPLEIGDPGYTPPGTDTGVPTTEISATIRSDQATRPATPPEPKMAYGGDWPPPDFASREQAFTTTMAKLGHPVMKTSGARTASRQAELYKQGRSSPGGIVTEKSGAPGDESLHQLGTAADYAFVGPDGKPDYSPSRPWDLMGRMARIHGLEWGGDWTSLVDRPHIQMPQKGKPVPKGTQVESSPTPTGPGSGTGPSPGSAVPPGVPGTVTSPVTPSTPVAASVPAGPTTLPSGAILEPMTEADHVQAPATSPVSPLPLWRQVSDPIADALPWVLGATGGMLGGVAAAPTAAVSGPAGPALAAIGGAYAGGLAGEWLKQHYDSFVKGTPSLSALESFNRMGAEGRSQIYQEMLGLGIAAKLADRAALKAVTGGTAETLAASEKYGLKLSAADISNSRVGRGLAKVMNYISMTAKTATDAARKAGNDAATKAVSKALDTLSVFHTNMETGVAIQKGIAAGKQAFSTGPVNTLYQTAKVTGANVDLRPHIQDLLDIFNREGTTASARRAILNLFPKPLNTLPAPIRWNTPNEPFLVTFEQAAKLRGRFGRAGRKALEAIGTDATSIATKLYGDLSDTLARAQPDFRSVSNLYRDARVSLANRVLTSMLKSKTPDKIVAALGPSPSASTVLALRKTMVNLTQGTGPGAIWDTGTAGFQALRRSWFDMHILRDSAGKADPAGMLARMDRANGALREFFGINKYDPEGQAVLDTAREIASAFTRRIALPNAAVEGRFRSSELTGLAVTAIRYGAKATGIEIGAGELLPGLITWMMHRPMVARQFITGFTHTNTIRGAQLMGRAIAGYLASGGPGDISLPTDPGGPGGSHDPNDLENLPEYTGAPQGAPAPALAAPGAAPASVPTPGKPQATLSPTDPMAGAPINVQTWDPDTMDIGKGTPSPPAAPVMARASAPGPGPASLQPPQTPSPWTKASGISADPLDPLLAQQRADEERFQTPFAIATAIGDKIRSWGAQMGAYTSGTENRLLASLGGAFMGGTQGAAQALEQNLTPEAAALSIVPLHGVDKLAELTRSLGASAEGAPGFFSRLTRAIEAVPTISARKGGLIGMVDPKEVLKAIATASPDEVAWKQVVPYVREHMAANGEKTPMSKADLLTYLESKKIALTKKSNLSGPEPIVPIGDPIAIPETYSRGAGFRLDIGDHGMASWTKNAAADAWVARVPVDINDGLPEWYQYPDPTLADGTPVPISDIHQSVGSQAMFDTPEQAEGWVRARLSMGAATDSGLQYSSYMVPGPGERGTRILPREDRHILSGRVPANQVDTQAHKGHFPEFNVITHVRGQDYTLEPGRGTQESWLIHDHGPLFTDPAEARAALETVNAKARDAAARRLKHTGVNQPPVISTLDVVEPGPAQSPTWIAQRPGWVIRTPGQEPTLVGQEWFPTTARDTQRATLQGAPDHHITVTHQPAVPAAPDRTLWRSQSVSPGEAHWEVFGPDGQVHTQFADMHEAYARKAAQDTGGQIRRVEGTPGAPRDQDLYTVHDQDGKIAEVYGSRHYDTGGAQRAAEEHAHRIGGAVTVDPRAPSATGTLLDEIQSDWHQNAKRARKLEVARLREAEIQKRIAANPNTPKAEIRAQVPRQAFDAQVPEDFGYKNTRANKAQVDKLKVLRDAANTEYEAARVEYEKAQDDWHDEEVRVQHAALRQFGFNSLGEARVTYTNRGVAPEGFESYDAWKTHAAQAREAFTAAKPDQTFRDTIDAARLKMETAEQAVDAYRSQISTIENSGSGYGKVSDAPLKDAWQDYALKHEILQASVDPEKSFLGFVGGQEQADRYGLAHKIGKVVFNPESQELIVYDHRGDELETYDLGSKNPSLGALMEYLPEGAAYDLFDRIQDWEPPTEAQIAAYREANGLTRQNSSTSRRRGRHQDIDWETYGTARERREAMREWMNREREAYEESERNEIRIKEVEAPNPDYDPEGPHEDVIHFDPTEQPSLPHLPQQEFSTRRPIMEPMLDDNGRPMFHDDGTPMLEQKENPEEETITKYHVYNPNYDSYDPEDPDTFKEFDTEREAERYADELAAESAQNYEPDEPDDLEQVYGHLDPPDEDGTDIDTTLLPSIDQQGLQQGGEGMLSSYDHVLRHRIEKLLAPFGGGLMEKILIPPGSSGATRTGPAYAWIIHLTPAMKEKILKAGFSLMGVALAVRESNAPPSVKTAFARAAILQKRKSLQSKRQPAVQ